MSTIHKLEGNQRKTRVIKILEDAEEWQKSWLKPNIAEVFIKEICIALKGLKFDIAWIYSIEGFGSS